MVLQFYLTFLFLFCAVHTKRNASAVILYNYKYGKFHFKECLGGNEDVLFNKDVNDIPYLRVIISAHTTCTQQQTARVPVKCLPADQVDESDAHVSVC